MLIVCCLFSCLTWLCSKIFLSLYLENSSPGSWEGKECLSPHRERQRNTAPPRAAESQVQQRCIAWTAGGENKGRREEGTAVEILVWRDRCIEKTVVCYHCKACWTWKQSQYTSLITGTHHFFKPRFFSFLIQFVILVKSGFIKTPLSSDETE